MLLRSDGTAVACGANDEGQCNIPYPIGDLKCTQVAAGCEFTVVLRSDGDALICGAESSKTPDFHIPDLAGDLTYTQVAAGSLHALLLRSDGTAVACGENCHCQCDIPRTHSLLGRCIGRAPCVRYIPNPVTIQHARTLVLQASFSRHVDDHIMHFSNMNAEELYSFRVLATYRAADIVPHILTRLNRQNRQQGNIEVVLPDGQLLSRIVSDDPAATLGSLM